MTRVTGDAATGNLVFAGRRVFPIGLSDPPPLGSKAPSGRDAWAEIAAAGAGFIRNYTVWTQAGESRVSMMPEERNCSGSTMNWLMPISASC